MPRFSLALAAGALALTATGTVQAQAPAAGRPLADRGADLTRAAFAERAGQMFDRMDLNRDGRIDAADREAGREQRFGKIDANRDGEVSRAEMQAAHDARKARMEERRAAREAKSGERHERRFAMLDTDGSGTLSKAEMAAAREKRGAMRAERRGAGDGERMERQGKRGGHKMGGRGGKAMWGGMIRQADANNDRSVTRAEFDRAVSAHFARMDADGNGTVTAAERQTARAAMKAQRQERRGGGQ